MQTDTQGLQTVLCLFIAVFITGLSSCVVILSLFVGILCLLILVLYLCGHYVSLCGYFGCLCGSFMWLSRCCASLCAHFAPPFAFCFVSLCSRFVSLNSRCIDFPTRDLKSLQTEILFCLVDLFSHPSTSSKGKIVDLIILQLHVFWWGFKSWFHVFDRFRVTSRAALKRNYSSNSLSLFSSRFMRTNTHNS